MDVLLQQITNALVLGGAYVLVALGLFLIFSVLDIPNFAHGEMFAAGAYIQFLFSVQIGLPFVVGLILAITITAGLGVVLERLVFRRLQGVGLFPVLIASLALGIVLQQVIALIWGTSPVTVPPPVEGVTALGPVLISNYRLLVVAVVLVAAAGTAWLVYRSAFGKQLRALAQNRPLAELSGVRVARVGTLTFAIGSALAGLAGGLLAAAGPMNPYMGFHPMLVAFVVLVVMGAGGRLSAAVTGGLTVAIVETLTAGYVSNALRLAVVFVALVAFLVWRPEGAIRQASAERARL
ncbi:branched-chain amino acid ABC transporter permease [Pseudonocardia nematodicida]|uniref:Branched-chain amino acid ABC transporter permease n=1 Tax=Pseudonocardia nematodicida TaxID=1206997 RepID=A0ABV1KFI9_9PSEU